MAAPNTTPLFSRRGNIDWHTVITSNTAMDGTGTVYTVWTADATNGGYLKKLRLQPIGTNASAGVIRIFVNNGGTNGTAANNRLFMEVSVPATTVAQNAAMMGIEVPMEMMLDPGYTVFCAGSMSSSNFTSGWAVTAFGGDY